jgi:hypothetical protein
VFVEEYDSGFVYLEPELIPGEVDGISIAGYDSSSSEGDDE